MICLLQTKIADTAQTEIFASVTRPFSQFSGGAWGQARLVWPCSNIVQTDKTLVYSIVFCVQQCKQTDVDVCTHTPQSSCLLSLDGVLVAKLVSC